MSFLNLPSHLSSPFAALWKNLSTACVDLCFPPLCIHCGAKSRLVLCSDCSQFLELAEAPPIKKCPAHTLWSTTFVNEGPARTLLFEFEKGLRPMLAPALAGFVVLQLINLGWRLPDLVLPMPGPIFDFFEKHYQPSNLLAEAVANIIPNVTENLASARNRIFSRVRCKSSSIFGKNVLFVGTSLDERKARRFAHRLQEQFPKEVRGLFLCG